MRLDAIVLALYRLVRYDMMRRYPDMPEPADFSDLTIAYLTDLLACLKHDEEVYERKTRESAAPSRSRQRVPPPGVIPKRLRRR